MTESDAPSRREIRQHEIATSSAWQPVLAHFDYNAGFALGLILVASPAEAEDCRFALSTHLSRSGKTVLNFSPPSPDSLKQIASPLLSVKIAEDVGAVWVSAVVTELSGEFEAWFVAWREGLARLNQFRNRLQRQVPCTLVFVGAPWVAAGHAYYGARYLVHPLVGRPTHTRLYPYALGWASKELASAARLLGSPDAPDPEFALEEAERLKGRPGQELTLATLLHRAGTGFFDRDEYALAAKYSGGILEPETNSSSMPIARSIALKLKFSLGQHPASDRPGRKSKDNMIEKQWIYSNPKGTQAWRPESESRPRHIALVAGKPGSSALSGRRGIRHTSADWDRSIRTRSFP